MDLKGIINAMLAESGFLTSQQYAKSPNPDDVQVFALANRSARELSKYNWQALRRVHEIQLTDSELYDLPTDYRQLINDTMWSKGQNRPIDSPTNDLAWAYLKSHSGSTGIQYKARILNNKINVINPTPGDVIRFEYISNFPAADREGERLERFSSDTDIWLLDDDLLIMDLTWRFKKAKGVHDWQEDKASCEKYKRSLQGSDESAKVINTLGGDDSAALNEPYYELYR